MTDAARKQWAFRREMEEEATNDARAEYVPSLPWPPKRVEGEVVEPHSTPESEKVIESTRAVVWDEAKQKLPTPAKSLRTAAVKAKYDVIIAHNRGERRGSHGRLLDPDTGTYCTVMARRGDEAFMATWCKPDGKDKWSFHEGMDLTPGIGPVRPKMHDKITQLKKDRLT